jgi:hypothetical protein
MLLTGLTTQDAGALAVRARAWLNPPHAEASSGRISYDQAQRSYLVEGAKGDQPVQIIIHASIEQPLVNPAVLVSGWSRLASITVEGAQLASSAIGYADRLDSRDLIAYFPLTSTSRITITITPDKP